MPHRSTSGDSGCSRDAALAFKKGLLGTIASVGRVHHFKGCSRGPDVGTTLQAAALQATLQGLPVRLSWPE